MSSTRNGFLREWRSRKVLIGIKLRNCHILTFLLDPTCTILQVHSRRVPMATTIPEIAEALSAIFTSTAEAAARDTKFVQRRSKMSGEAFVQTLTFGWLANPQATLEELTQMAATR